MKLLRQNVLTAKAYYIDRFSGRIRTQYYNSAFFNEKITRLRPVNDSRFTSITDFPRPQNKSTRTFFSEHQRNEILI